MDPCFRFGRATSWYGALLCMALGAAAPGCGTDPVNPDGCRLIEDARCEAVAACPGYAGFDVDACKRFYRDQCLHGLSSQSDPGDPSVNLCVDAIKVAGDCAKNVAATCTVGQSTVDACAVIEHPEQFVECSFLAPSSTPAADAGADAAEEPAETTGDSAAAEAPLDEGG